MNGNWNGGREEHPNNVDLVTYRIKLHKPVLNKLPTFISYNNTRAIDTKCPKTHLQKLF